ncbi:transcriptional regulator, AraC family [Leptolyngbya sp. NIES-3755]|nr:transcriptional regulator, AraC family [Leptolyngbya sp. NIES-3755]
MQDANALPEATIVKSEWDGLTVEYGRLDATGDFDFSIPKRTLSVILAPHDRVTWSVDGTKQTTALPAGTVLLYGDREFVWHERHKSSEYVNLDIETTLLEQIATENGLSSVTGLEHRVMFQDAMLTNVAQLLRSELSQTGIASNLYVESIRNLLAVHLLRNYAPQNAQPVVQTGALDDLTVKRLKDYIEDNLAEELSIAQLAALVPMSQFHFARAFKSAIGEPPHRYVLSRRIDRAKVLLSATRLSIAEVAYQVGFSNQSHFIAQFRKALGMTPKQFRD